MSSTQAESASFNGQWLRERPQDYGAQTRSRLSAGLLIPAARYIEALDLRAKVLADFAAAVFSRAELLHLPVVAVPLPISAATARRRTIANALAWGRGVSLSRLVPRAIVRNNGP